MAHGISIRTQNGMMNAYDMISFRVVDTKTVAGGIVTSTFSLANCVDLNGKNYMFFAYSAFANSSVDPIYYTTVDEISWNYSNTITASTTLNLVSRSSTGNGNVTVTLFAVEI